MIELRTLGAADLRDGEGHEVRAVLQQPKRLALLVYLATAKPGKFHRRDSLLAAFWPDLDQDHARAALRRALYFLRQALGALVIAGRGDDEVGIEPGLLWCDALAFDELVQRDEALAAMELYDGDFLDGFYVQGAPEAEAWLDRERSRRRDDAAALLWGLAADQRLDPVAAGRWIRRAIDLAPGDQDAAIRALAGLECRGERGLALRLADYLVQRLASDLESEPAPPLAVLIERLRETPVPGRAAGDPSPAPTDTLVAVCPFVVHGDPAYAYLGEGMMDLLSTKLDGTGELRTCDPGTILRLAAGAGREGTGVESGQAIARRLGAGQFTVGAVIESGGRLEVGMGLYNQDGRLRARAEARAPNEAGLFEVVDELVRRLVVARSQGAADRLSRLAALTTESLPALKAHLIGEQEFRLGRHLQALDGFRHATVEDRSFALAYYRLASSLAASALIGPARQASTEAFRHRERLSDHDRLLLEAQHAWLHGQVGEAERRYAALTVSFPEHVEAWYLLGDLLVHANPYRGRSIVEAREPLERTLAIDPAHVGALTQLARLAALDGRLDELVVLVDRALAASPSSDQALSLRTLRAYALRHDSGQREVTAELLRAPGLAVARAFTDVALYTQDWAGAEELARAILPAARSVEFEALGHLMLAHLAMARGRPRQADDLLRVAARHEPAWSLEIRGLFAALPFDERTPAERESIEAEVRAFDPATVRSSVSIPLAFHDGLHPHLRGFVLGLLRARAGDARGVSAEAEALAELPVPASAEVLVQRLGRTLDAVALRLAERPAEALAVLERPGAGVWFQLAVGSPFYAGTYERFLRAELLAEVGRHEAALGWWQTVAQRSPYELVFLAAAERRQAELLTRMGRPEQARRHQARADALWTGEPA